MRFEAPVHDEGVRVDMKGNQANADGDRRAPQRQAGSASVGIEKQVHFQWRGEVCDAENCGLNGGERGALQDPKPVVKSLRRLPAKPRPVRAQPMSASVRPPSGTVAVSAAMVKTSILPY